MQHLINRVNALGGLGEVYLNLEELRARGNKKWKQLPLASAASPSVPSVDAAGGVDAAGAMFQAAAIPTVYSVDPEGRVDTVGGVLQKVEAARAICSSLMDQLASDAPDTDRTEIVEKLLKQEAILLELKSECTKLSIEPSLAPSKELPPASQLPIARKGSAPSKELSLAPQLLLPISKASAPSKELAHGPQLSLPIFSKASAPSKELFPVPELSLPIASKPSGDIDLLFGDLEKLFPEENFDEAENMKNLQNICVQTIPEEQLDQSYADILPPSPSTQR